MRGRTGTPQGPDGSGLSWTRRVRRRRTKVPTILQLESVECGAAALAMVLARYHVWLPLEDLRTACSVSRDGANALNMVRAARELGLEADGYRRELEELPAEPFPVIAYWGFNHFVVVEGVSRKGLYVNDPAAGRRVVPWEEADRSFTGVVLRFAPTPQLERRGRAPSALRSLVPLTVGSRPAILFAVAAGLALLVPALALPLVPKLYLDTVIGGGATSWAYAVALALGVALLLQWYFLRLQQLVALRFNVKLGLLLGNRLVSHALRLPQAFFEQRAAGDVAYRVTLAGQVAATLSGQVAPAMLGAVVALLYLGLLAVLSLPLAGIAVAGGIVQALALWLVRRRRRELSMRVTKHVTAFNSTVAYGLRTIETVKAGGAEGDLFGSVTGLNARVLSSWIAFERPTVGLSAMPGFVAQAATLAALGVGALLALDGELSLGALLAAIVALAGFSSPIGTIVNLATTGQQLRANLARMEDLENQAEDPVLTAPPPFESSGNGSRRPAGETPPRAKLRGELELRGVTFGYDRSAGPLLSGFDLRLRPGSRIAVVGPTGSGKSTVAKLASGLLLPWDGEVLLDGRPYLEWPRETVTNSLAMVSQDIVLFAGTVRENLTLWDRSIPDEDVVAAARDARIHATIIARPGDYEAAIHEAGRNWSGGEGQRLEIARSLATRPTVLVLDEATSALDPIVELAIVQALRRRGLTMLVVAHRLSTVRDADEILVLDRGRVAERGTHEELIGAGGRYEELVAAE